MVFRLTRLPEPRPPEEYTISLLRALNQTFLDINNNLRIIEETPTFESAVIVTGLEDLPEPSSGVITLEDKTAYIIDGYVDLEENRIVCGVDNAMFGFGAEASVLHNSLDNESLITSTESLTIWKMALYVTGTGATILDLNADTATVSRPTLLWQFVNFTGGDIGTIANYSNCVFTGIEYSDRSGDGFPALGDGLIFDGTFDTVAFTESLFIANSSGNTALTVPSTATINRRIRFANCAIEASTGATGFDVSTSATIDPEGYILAYCNFSGAGTVIAGIDYTDNIARFESNRGITNTYAASYITMTGNATATTISAVDTPVKIAGTTTNQTVTSKFDNTTSNKSIYTGSLTRTVSVKGVCSLTGNANKEIGVFVAKNGSVLPESVVYVTTDTAGRLENVTVLALVQMETNDYIELWIENATDSSNVTVDTMTVLINDM